MWEIALPSVEKQQYAHLECVYAQDVLLWGRRRPSASASPAAGAPPRAPAGGGVGPGGGAAAGGGVRVVVGG